MTARRVAPRPTPFPRYARHLLAAAVALLVGFLVLQAPPVKAAFDAVAELLATCGEVILKVFGYPIVRSGVELRDTVTGHAIVVTEACDGSSLIIAATAALAWLWRGRGRDVALLAVAALLVIFAFNLLRIVLLFVSIGIPPLMTAQHLYVAPLLSALLVAGIAVAILGLPLQQLLRAPILWAGVAVLGAIAWYPLAEPVTCAAVVPIANTLLWLTPGELERAISCGVDGTIVATAAVIAQSPVRVLDVPFFPADFTLALPLVAASLALARRPAAWIGGAAISLLLFASAMAIAAMTASQDAASANGVTTLMGQSFTTPFAPLGETGLALLKATQNALVHFNLFLLPLVLLETSTPPPATATSRATRPPTPRGGAVRSR